MTVSIVLGSLAIACIGALAIGILLFLILSVSHGNAASGDRRVRQRDFRTTGIVSAVATVLIFIPCFLIGWTFSNMCGTSDVSEFMSPDGKHKIVVYNFDCGATTDFSMDVSLLGGSATLPKNRVAPLLYSHYHSRPVSSGAAKNFAVSWMTPTEVRVEIANLAGSPTTKRQDGVSIRLDSLRWVTNRPLILHKLHIQ